MTVQRAILIAVLLVTAACTRDNWIDRLPPELRAEARAVMPIRKKECDALQASIRPSRDRSGGFSVLGVGITFRDAQLSTGGARDQYLIALNDMLSACRRWQRFEAGSAEGYREAQLRAARVAEGPLREAGNSEALDRLTAAIAEARTAGSGTDALQEEIARLRESFEAEAARDADPAPGSRFDAIEFSLRSLDSKVSNLSARRDALAPPAEWRVRFGRDSSRPDERDIDRVRQAIEIWLQRCSQAELALTGYADSSGSSETNLWLAKARADAVHRSIGDLGATAILSSAFGETSRFGAGPEANRVVSVRATCFESRASSETAN